MNSKNIIDFKILLRLLLAATFLLSAYSKIILPGSIEIILIDQGIITDRAAAAYVVRLFIGLELAIGLLFVFPYYLKSITIPLTWGLLFFFTGYLSYTGFVLGDKNNCGCFGELIKMTPLESIIKNIFLLILSFLLFYKTKDDRRKIILPLSIILISFPIIFLISPVRDVSEFKFSKYIYFEGKGRVDLSSSNILLGVFGLDCEHCQQTATLLADIKRENTSLPEIYVLFFSEGNTTVEQFNTITYSSFPYHMIDAGDFFNLIGSQPPRIYWLKEGNIEKFWDNNFEKSLLEEFGK
ncbi:MAG: MauE/DoxX family redox-associated membrane protein [Bacteroidota bacterium]